jgi:hypothetical protein
MWFRICHGAEYTATGLFVLPSWLQSATLQSGFLLVHAGKVQWHIGSTRKGCSCDNTDLHWLLPVLVVDSSKITNPDNKRMVMLIRLVIVSVGLALKVCLMTMATLALRSNDPT